MRVADINDFIAIGLYLEDHSLDIHEETWEDPGDYPSGAGGCALSSRHAMVCDGDIRLRISVNKSFADLFYGRDVGEDPSCDDDIMKWLKYAIDEPEAHRIYEDFVVFNMGYTGLSVDNVNVVSCEISYGAVVAVIDVEFNIEN